MIRDSIDEYPAVYREIGEGWKLRPVLRHEGKSASGRPAATRKTPIGLSRSAALEHETRIGEVKPLIAQNAVTQRCEIDLGGDLVDEEHLGRARPAWIGEAEILNPHAKRIAPLDLERPDAERAIEAARRAFDEGQWWPRTSERDRGRILLRAAEIVRREQERLAPRERLVAG